MAQPDIPAKKSKTEDNMVILVTGGGGLVGMGLKAEVEKVKSPNEQWIFLRSADGDLRYPARAAIHMHGKEIVSKTCYTCTYTEELP